MKKTGKIEVLYVFSNTTDSESYLYLFEGFDNQIFNFSFIFLNPGPSNLGNSLRDKGYRVMNILYRGKTDFLRAIIKTSFYLLRNRPLIVHCHLLDASLVGLIAAKVLRIRGRIYTRHYSDYHHRYSPKGLKYDRLCNRLATKIIATNVNVFRVLTEMDRAPKDKVVIINLGFVLKKFYAPDKQQISQLSDKYNPKQKHPVIGIISRYDEYKGIEYIVKAFKMLLQEFPDAYLIHANAVGPYQLAIDACLSLPKETYCKIGFERNPYALYQLFDVFVHVPINATVEAFGQVYVEAMAAGIPSVFTISGIASEYVQDNINALTVNYQDADSIFQAIVKILKQKGLAKQLAERAQKDVLNKFDISTMTKDLETLYRSVE